LPSIPTALIPPVTQPDPTPIRQYTRRARISQSSALLTVADKPASPVRDVSEGEACPAESGFIADQDRATIAKSSTLPHDSAPRVTSPAAAEGILEDRECNTAKQSRDDTPIKGRSINEGEAAAERISNDSEEIARVLTSMDAATVLVGGIDIPTGSGSIPTAGGIDVPTGSGFIPTTGPPTTVISTGSEIARDAEVARIHAEEELQEMIDSLDQSNETIAKYLQEYQDFASELPLKKRIELISDLVEDFIPMGSNEETERLKKKGLNLEKEQVNKQKSSEEALEIETSTKEFTEEKMKEMMQRSYFPCANTIPRHSRKKNSSVVESEIRTNVTMADRTMKELLQAPSEGYEEAIVIPEIIAKNFEIKTNLLQDVSNDAIKLMLFPYSLEDRARIWYEKEHPNLILTWEDLVNKFVNQFFPPSKTTH
nr:hypothetical protein [Tanacetum cinerariifolium]